MCFLYMLFLSPMDNDQGFQAPANYECKDFHTRALQQSKVHLSWDNDEPERIRTLRQKLSQKQLDGMEFKDFLASDDDEDDNDDDDDHKEQTTLGNRNRKEKKRDKFLALLQSGDGSEDSKEDMDMEVTFNTDLENISNRVLEKEKDKDSESVWEAYLRKKREKKKVKRVSQMSSEDESSDSYDEVADQPDDFFVDEELDANGEKVVDTGSRKDGLRKKKSIGGKKEKRKTGEVKENGASREELELLLAEDNVAANKLKGYNLKSKKKKKGKKKEVLSDDEIAEVDYNDPRLSALFTSPLFALDPTDPRYKRSAAYLRQQSCKQKGIVDEPMVEETNKADTDQVKAEDKPARKDKFELMSLVKSVKRKVGSIPNWNK